MEGGNKISSKSKPAADACWIAKRPAVFWCPHRWYPRKNGSSESRIHNRIVFISLGLQSKCFFEDFIAKKVKSFAMKYHKCHLKIKVGTRTEDRVAAGIINFNLIFSSEPTDSGP